MLRLLVLHLVALGGLHAGVGDGGIDGVPDEEIIVDNGDDGTSSSGLWILVSADDDWARNVVVTTRDDDSSTYRFETEIPSAGHYEIFLWWPSEGRLSSQTSAVVEYANGESTVQFRQDRNGGQWNSLGKWDFDEDVRVEIVAGGSGRAAADAMKVVPVNAPPTASIDSVTPSPAVEGDTVHLEGSTSDSDGEVVAWLWESDLDGQFAVTEDADTNKLSVGTHQLTFWAQDDAGDWSEPATAQLVVDPLPNQPPVAAIESIIPNPAFAGAIVQMSGSTSDSDGVIVGHLWVSDLVGEIGTQEDLSIDTLGVGQHTISYSCQDDDLEWSTPATSQLVILETLNQAPSVSILSISPNPAGDGETVSFDGSATDADGNIIAHLWISDIVGEIAVTEDFSTDSLPPGTHTIFYSAQDDDLAWSTPDSAQLVINEPPQSAPRRHHLVRHAQPGAPRAECHVRRHRNRHRREHHRSPLGLRHRRRDRDERGLLHRHAPPRNTQHHLQLPGR